MDTLYTARLHGFPNFTKSGLEPALTEESVLSLLVVLGSSISLVAIVFAFITYRSVLAVDVAGHTRALVFIIEERCETPDVGPRLPCSWCRALKWKDEAKGMCCHGGKVQINILQPYPEPLHTILKHQPPAEEHYYYSLFSDLRNLSGTTLMNLLAALFMSQLLYVVGVGGVPDSELCISLAFALQYSRLSIFCWMILMAHNMNDQFKNGLHLVPITDNRITRRFMRYSIFGWGLPSIWLAVSILIQYLDKHGQLLDTTGLKEQNCWFLDRNAFLYGHLAPCCLLIFGTFYYLIHSAVLARYIISMQAEARTREKMRRKRTLQILLFSKLTIVLSFVLALGALTKLTKSEPIWIAYHVAQGLQGIVVAMMVTCNCQILKLYTRSIKSRASKHVPYCVGGAASSCTGPSKSTSLQLLTWEPMPNTV